MKIEVVSTPDATSKEKGDLLEALAGDLLTAQSYRVIKQVRVTAAELDLLCEHSVSGKSIYVECKAHREVFSLALWKFVFSVSMPEKFLL